MRKAIKRTNLIVAFLAMMLLVAVPVYAARFEFVPATGNLVNGCSYNLVIYADATGEASNAADLIVTYNPAQIEILDSIGTDSGVQIQPGSAYQAYVGNIVDTNAGKITVTAFSVGADLSARKPFATIKIRPMTLGNTVLQIQFTGIGQTLDSNIANSVNSLDILTNVTNANFNVVNGSCEQDTQAPVVQFISPTLNQTGFSGNTITLQVTDAGSGVQLNSVQIVVDGISYNINSPEVSYQPVGSGYAFTITLPDSIHSDASGTIVVIASDQSNNTTTATNNFNQPGSMLPPADCELPNNFLVTGNPAYIFENTFLENTVIHNIVNQIAEEFGETTASSVVLGVISLLVSLRYLLLFTSPLLLFNVLVIVTGRKADRRWGIVLDDATKNPIGLAICRLYLKDTNSVVAQTVTDSKGRYGFSVDEGEYRLEVSKSDYATFAKDIIIKSGKAVNAKVYLSPSSLEQRESFTIKDTVALILSGVWSLINFLQVLLLVLGLGLSTAALVFSLSILNLMLFAVHLIAVLVLIYYRARKHETDSMIIDKKTNYRLTNVRLHIYSLQSGELVDVIPVGPSGSFDYFGEEGEFGITLQSANYKLLPEGFETRKLEKLNVLVVKLNTGGNKLKLFAEKFAENNLSGNNSNYPNPFVG